MHPNAQQTGNIDTELQKLMGQTGLRGCVGLCMCEWLCDCVCVCVYVTDRHVVSMIAEVDRDILEMLWVCVRVLLTCGIHDGRGGLGHAGEAVC